MALRVDTPCSAPPDGALLADPQANARGSAPPDGALLPDPHALAPRDALAPLARAEHPPRLDEIPREFSLLWAYDGLHRAYGEVYTPRSIDELRLLFQMATRQRRRVTLRAGGQSFDGQALNGDLVISMERFDSIEPDPERARVTVGAGATWGAIVRALAPLGLVPYVVVSTSFATAGGTASGDCLSRFSSAVGKEGRHIERIELLTVEGRLLELTAEGDTSALFHAVVGGLGYLGAIVRVTYRVARVGQPGDAIRLETRATRHSSAHELIDALVPRDEAPGPEARSPLEARSSLEARYSIAYRTLTGVSSIVLRSRYVAGRTPPPLRPMPQHQPYHLLRVPTEWLLRSPEVSQGVWTLVDRVLFDYEHPYVDDLLDYTFFMDGNVRSKRVAQACGVMMSTTQQGFMLPVDRADREGSLRRAATFLDRIDAIAVEDGIPPTLLDVLHLRADDFLLSANRGTDALSVTLAFESSDEISLERIHVRLAELTELALKLGGRVYLAKNVHAAGHHVEAMYADALPELVRLKRLVDPEGILRNDFLERLFPAHFPARGVRLPPDAPTDG